MKYLKQFGIIICISLIGEILNNVLPSKIAEITENMERYNAKEMLCLYWASTT